MLFNCSHDCNTSHKNIEVYVQNMYNTDVIANVLGIDPSTWATCRVINKNHAKSHRNEIAQITRTDAYLMSGKLICARIYIYV